MHLQVSTSAEDTLQAKVSFETMARGYGVRIRKYHADNGVFVSHLWKENCKEQRQNLTYTGVNAHHQNGVAKRRIRYLRDLSRTSLNHAIDKWNTAITHNLWPYAMCHASDALNYTKSSKLNYNYSPINVFSNSNRK